MDLPIEKSDLLLLLLHRKRSWREAAEWYRRALDMDSAGTASVTHSWCTCPGMLRSFHQTILAVCLVVDIVVLRGRRSESMT